MLFNSYVFLLIFLPAAILVYRIADDYPQCRIGALVVLSRDLLRLLGRALRSADDRLDPRQLGGPAGFLTPFTKRPSIIVAAIVGNLAVLGLFKYANFFGENAAPLLGTGFEPLQLALPLGISFFTFHHIMYLVDLPDRKAPLYPLDRYALYICFFPQAIAGPIARWNEVMHQFGRRAFGPGWERRCVAGAIFGNVWAFPEGDYRRSDWLQRAIPSTHMR